MSPIGGVVIIGHLEGVFVITHRLMDRLATHILMERTDVERTTLRAGAVGVFVLQPLGKAIGSQRCYEMTPNAKAGWPAYATATGVAESATMEAGNADRECYPPSGYPVSVPQRVPKEGGIAGVS